MAAAGRRVQLYQSITLAVACKPTSAIPRGLKRGS